MYAHAVAVDGEPLGSQKGLETLQYSKDLPNGKLHLSQSLQRPHTVTIETGIEMPHLLKYSFRGLQIYPPRMLEGHLLPFHPVFQSNKGSVSRETSADCSQNQESDRRDVLLRAFCCAADLLRMEVSAAGTGGAMDESAVQQAFLTFTAQLLFPTPHRLEVCAGAITSAASQQLNRNKSVTLKSDERPLLLSVHPVLSMHSCLRLSCCQFALQGIVGEGYNRVLDGTAQDYPDDGSFIGHPDDYILPGYFPRSGASLTAYGGQPVHALRAGRASQQAA